MGTKVTKMAARRSMQRELDTNGASGDVRRSRRMLIPLAASFRAKRALHPKLSGESLLPGSRQILIGMVVKKAGGERKHGFRVTS